MQLARFAASARRPLLVLASAGVIVAVLVIPGVQPARERSVAPPVRTPAPTAVPTFTPLSMEIPAISMDAPIVPVGTLASGMMESPKGAKPIGWWAGRKAGDGNSLFAAHHDWSGETGSFYRLEELKKGNRVIVQGRWRTLTYRVVWKQQVSGDIDATQLLGPQGSKAKYGENGKPVATLITCGGAFNTQTGHHVDRIVVRAELEA